MLLFVSAERPGPVGIPRRLQCNESNSTFFSQCRKARRSLVSRQRTRSTHKPNAMKPHTGPKLIKTPPPSQPLIPLQHQHKPMKQRKRQCYPLSNITRDVVVAEHEDQQDEWEEGRCVGENEELVWGSEDCTVGEELVG